MADYKLKADETAQLDVQMGNKVKHLTFEHNKEDPDAVWFGI
jgi:hypothetical protein